MIANALNDLPATFEQLAATQSNVARLRSAGVTVALGMINDDEARQVRLARQQAGNMVAVGRLPGASGLSWGEALATITSAPAEAVGMGGEIGSLRAGRRADVVIWSGDPLENSSAAELVLIDGVQQPLDNHQTKLRDRYRTADRGRPAQGLRKVIATGQSRARDSGLRRHPSRFVASAADAAGRPSRRADVPAALFGGGVGHFGLDDPRLAGGRGTAFPCGRRRPGPGRSPRARCCWPASSSSASFFRNPAFPIPARSRKAVRPASGVFAVTRHPMNMAFILWALVHIALWGSPPQPDRRGRHPDPRPARLDRPGRQEARTSSASPGGNGWRAPPSSPSPRC